MKPVIGITSGHGYKETNKFNTVKTTYADAVLMGGGIPLIIPVVHDEEIIGNYLDLVDGILFTGGEDISPLAYGENPMKEVANISYDRDEMELALYKGAYDRKIPILGICRGLQLINVAMGGTLYQDLNLQLPQALGHVSTYDITRGYHNIEIKEDTVLHEIFGLEKINVNSNHHQSIKDLGKALKINSLSTEGIIEGIESPKDDNFVLGVQFHPEAMVHKHKEFIGIFEYFVKRCS